MRVTVACNQGRPCRNASVIACESRQTRLGNEFAIGPSSCGFVRHRPEASKSNRRFLKIKTISSSLDAGAQNACLCERSTVCSANDRLGQTDVVQSGAHSASANVQADRGSTNGISHCKASRLLPACRW